jgi:hypothetical protein
MNGVTFNFPPEPRHHHEVELLVEGLRCILDPRSAVYLSAPLTSGKNHWPSGGYVSGLDLLGAPTLGRDPSFTREANRLHARAIAGRLRKEMNRVVIDPTAVSDFPGWGQDDYRYLWARVIEEYVERVVLTDNWQYSNGCAYEFLIATRCRIPNMDERLNTVTLESGTKMLEGALEEVRANGQRAAFLGRVVAELLGLGRGGAAL